MMTDADKVAAVRTWIAMHEADYRRRAPHAMFPHIERISFEQLAVLIGEPISDLPEPWEGPRTVYVKVGGHSKSKRR